MIYRPQSQDRRGFVLLSVLVVVVLLTLAAYQFSELMSAEYRASDRTMRTAQARAFAESGVQYAAGVLSDPNAVSGLLGGNIYDNPAAFQGVLVQPNSNPRLQGRFSLIALVDPDSTSGSSAGFRYGVTDEAGRININSLLSIERSGEVGKNMLLKLPGMTEDVANSTLDWIDADEELRTSGAESQSYAGQSMSYRCKNGPLDSLEELLYVRGMSAGLLFGNDRNRNGQLDPGEDSSGSVDRGIAPYLTIYSRELNQSSTTGEQRIFLNGSSLSSLRTKLEPVIGVEMTAYLILYRIFGASTSSGGNSREGNASDMAAAAKTASNSFFVRPRSISSIFELIDTKVSVPGSRGQPSTIFTSPLTKNSPTMRETLPKLFAETTTQNKPDLPGRININTAPYTVMSALPGINETDLLAIMERRPTASGGQTPDPIYDTIAWLITEANLQPQTLRGLERYITCTSQVYRVQSIGYFDEAGPTVRIEAVIDTNQGVPRILYWRDLTELGKGIVGLRE